MTGSQTRLTEFDSGDDVEKLDEPTPAENAKSITYLISLVDQLSEDVEQLADPAGQHDNVGSIEREPTRTTERMYQ